MASSPSASYNINATFQSSNTGAAAAATAPAMTTSTTTQEKTPLYRLAKLLNQTIKTSDQIVLKDDAPRRLSWER